MDRKGLPRQHRRMSIPSEYSPDLPAFAWLGQVDYADMWQRMQRRAGLLCGGRGEEVVWCCEHPPVYTTGKRGIDNRTRGTLPAPLLATDRGGETTFHGPGQLMLYPVISLRTRRIGVRDYVCLLEKSCIALLATYGIAAAQRDGLPGVWVGDAKIAAIGLRVAHGVAWHGMALNVSVAGEWFEAINACGAGLGVTSMQDFVQPPALAGLAQGWYDLLCAGLARPA